MKFYIITCDKTSHILKGTTYLYNKYVTGDYQFVVLGNNKPYGLPDNFEFVKIKDTDDTRRWTKSIHDYVKTQNDEYFGFALDDYLPASPANQETIDELMEYARSHKVGRISIQFLSPFDEEAFGPQTFPLEGHIIQQYHNTLYRISCQSSIWNREYFLKVFNHNWSPWNLELRGSKRAFHDDYETIGANPPPMNWGWGGALSAKWPGKINMRDVSQEDKDYFATIYKEEIIEYYGA